MALTVPGVNTPTYQSWAAQVASIQRSQSGITQTGTSDTPATLGAWPAQNTKTIQVPAWATSVFVINKLNGVYPQTSDVNIQVNLVIDGTAVEGSSFAYILNAVSRYDIVMMGTKDVTAKRGTNIVINTTAVRLTGTGWVRADTSCHFTFDIDFRP